MTRDRGWAGIWYASEETVPRLQEATKDSQGCGKTEARQSGASAVALRFHFLHDSVCVCRAWLDLCRTTVLGSRVG